MSTLSTNVVGNAMNSLFQAVCVVVSAITFSVFYTQFSNGADPFGGDMMSLFVLGMISALPAVLNPVNFLSRLYASLAVMAGAVGFAMGVFMVLPWFFSLVVIGSTAGSSHEAFLGYAVALPLYLVAPAVLGFVTMSRLRG